MDVISIGTTKDACIPIYDLNSKTLMEQWERLDLSLHGNMFSHANSLLNQKFSGNQGLASAASSNASASESNSRPEKRSLRPSAFASSHDRKYCVPIAMMGNYQELLSQREAPRDPLLADPPKDEDAPEGVRRRQISVDFGSPYRRSHHKSSSKLALTVRASPANWLRK